jgi:hypothetical protein
MADTGGEPVSQAGAPNTDADLGVATIASCLPARDYVG